MSRPVGLLLAVAAVVLGLALLYAGMAPRLATTSDASGGLLPVLGAVWAAGHLAGSRTTK